MIILRILLNGLIMAAEIAAIIAVAVAGFTHPFLFAAATAGLTFALGLRLEAARLRNELPFYFGAGTQRTFVLVPTRANGQPAFGLYVKGPDHIHRGSGLLVLELAGAEIAALTRFETSLFPWFGLPPTVPTPP